MIRARHLLSIAIAAVALAVLVEAPASAAPAPARLMRVVWMNGFRAPGTPAGLDKVGVLKIGPAHARNVLVFEPGTTAGSAYIVPLAQWLVRTLPGWQVWSIERRQNLLEDQSVLTRAKQRKVGAQAVYDYYLNWILNPSIKHHVRVPSDASVQFAKDWGLNVAVQDLRIVIRAAHRLGGKVVLSGHSLGGSLVTAYATWDFGGRPGARGLDGLVFDDGASFQSAVSAAKASSDLANLRATTSPWGGITVPLKGHGDIQLLGLITTAGALAAAQQPNVPSIGQGFLRTLLGSLLTPLQPLTNLALFAYDTNVSTSKLGQAIFAVLAHEGRGISARAVHGVYGWNAQGALTPPRRWAEMLGGTGVAGADGVEWYFPARLTLDTSDAINNGIAAPAQKVLDVQATMGDKLPRKLLMYAFGAAGGQAILQATRQLANQSHIPGRNLLLISRQGIYAHNDPAGAFPHNVFFTGLVRFLRRVGAQR